MTWIASHIMGILSILVFSERTVECTVRMQLNVGQLVSGSSPQKSTDPAPIGVDQSVFAARVQAKKYELVGAYSTDTEGEPGARLACRDATVTASNVRVTVSTADDSTVEELTLHAPDNPEILWDILNSTAAEGITFQTVGADTMTPYRTSLASQQRGFVGLQRVGGPAHQQLCAFIHWGIAHGPAYFAVSFQWNGAGASECDSRGGLLDVVPNGSMCFSGVGRRKSSLVATERLIGWRSDPWQLCEPDSSSCVVAQQTRNVTCSDHMQNTLNESDCSGLERPSSTQACLSVACASNSSALDASTVASAVPILPVDLKGRWSGAYATRSTQAYCGSTMKYSIVDMEVLPGSFQVGAFTPSRLTMTVREGITTPLPQLADMLQSGSQTGSAKQFLFQGIITGYDNETSTLSVQNPLTPAAGAKSLRFFPGVDGVPNVRKALADVNQQHLFEAGPGAALFAFSYDQPSITSLLPGPNGTAACAPKDALLLSSVWPAAPAGRIDFLRMGRQPGEIQLGGFDRCEPNAGMGVCQAQRQQLSDSCFVPGTTDEVDTIMCDGTAPPESETKNCSACVEFVTTEWTNCTAPCSGGTRERTATCVKTSYDSRPTEPNSVCESILGTPSPPEEERCNIEPCASWVVGQWGACSQSCGPGQQTRSVECREVQSGRLVQANVDRRCGGNGPAQSLACTLCPCQPTDQGEITAVRRVPDALQPTSTDDGSLFPLAPQEPSDIAFAGYRNISAADFCGRDQELLTIDEFRCFPDAFLRQLCTRVFSKASAGSLPVAFLASPDDLPLTVPRWLTQSGAANLAEVEPDIVLRFADSQCVFAPMLHEDNAFVVPDRQSAVGVCREAPLLQWRAHEKTDQLLSSPGMNKSCT